MKSIGRRLMIYFGLTILLACVGVGLIAYSSSSRVLERSAEQVLPEYASNTARYLENSIYLHLLNMESIANHFTIRSLDWTAQSPVLNDEAKRLGYLHMGFAGLDGQLKTTSGFSGDISKNPCFLQALQGKSVISEPLGNPATIMAATPVRDNGGNIVGVLTASLDGRTFSNIINQINVGKNGYAFMIDSHGKVIAHPDHSMVINQVNFISQTKMDNRYRELSEFLKQSINEKDRVGHYTFMGVKQYTSFAPVKVNGWLVVTSAPLKEVMAPLNQLGKAILFGTLFFLIIGLAIAFKAGRQITTPIHLISQQYSRMADGDFSGSLDIKWRSRRDEIGELARGFHHINRSLSRTISELEAGEQRFRMITENMVDLVSLTDLEGYFQYVSPSHEQVTGWKVRQVLGRCIFNGIHPDDVEQAREIYTKVINSRLPGTFTYRTLRADGEYRWLETMGKPLLDGNGQVVGIVSASRDVHERKEAEARLVYMAEHDSLTGLYNRSFFENQMRILDENLVVPAALIICDLDGLKFINDTLGHQAGDDLLLASAEIIINAVPEDSLVARIGGDEFGVLLSGYNDKLASLVADNIRSAIAHYNLTNPDILSISMGVATRLTPGLSMPALFKEASQQMYREKLLHNQSARSAVVDVVMTALEARDFVTEGHTDRLQNLATTIARRLEWPENRINDLTLFARFHDIGKVGVPDSILFKTGRLCPEEFEEMKKHSEIGYRIAQSSPELVHIADFILKHHEWWDGSGYPLGLKGDKIPMECRIVAVADAYDAMNSDRPYRKALPHRRIIQELKEGSGSQFDPLIVEIFLNILGED